MTISITYVVDHSQVIEGDGGWHVVSSGSETFHDEKNGSAQANYYSLQPNTEVTLTKYVRTWFPEYEGYEWVPEWTKTFTRKESF
jgi:hypothetical protein